MNKSIKVLLSIAAVTSLGWSTDISSWKPNYTSNGDVWIHLEDKPNNTQDWVGIYPKGSNNDWSNVVDWRWAKNTSKTQVDSGDWYKFKLDDGAYEARFFLNNSFNVEEKVGFVVGDVPVEQKEIIGARPVKSTPLSKGKLFASPNGHGDCMSVQSACDIYTAVNKLSSSNNVLFLRGGTYNLNKQLVISKYKNGTSNNPIIIESYPHEKAILNGNATIDKIKQGVSPVGGIYTEGKDKFKHLKIRNIEIKKIGGPGIILMRTKGITIEGCIIHDNYLSGIKLLGSDENTIIDNYIYNNSDKGLTKIGFLDFDNGGNADAISIIYSEKSLKNNISHNTVYHNSDDGIDAIGGIDTTISYNLSYNNLGIEGGKNGGHGNGIGIKACGKNARRAKVEHNIAFNNNGNGVECHVSNGDGVVFTYNISYKNGNYGFGLPEYSNVTLHHNISSNNAKSQVPYGNQSSNSWGISENINFMSTDIHSNNFLKPKSYSDFENMGAYANQ